MTIVNIGKALIRRKSDGKYLILTSSKWEERPDRSQQPDLAGGTVEAGETVEQGAVREIFEEAGITVATTDLKLVYASTFMSAHDGASINRLIYQVELSEDPEITLSWEHESYTWLSKEEVMNLAIRQPYPDIFRYLDTAGILT